jgi:hypothetical protein
MLLIEMPRIAGVELAEKNITYTQRWREAVKTHKKCQTVPSRYDESTRSLQ